MFTIGIKINILPNDTSKNEIREIHEIHRDSDSEYSEEDDRESTPFSVYDSILQTNKWKQLIKRRYRRYAKIYPETYLPTIIIPTVSFTNNKTEEEEDIQYEEEKEIYIQRIRTKSFIHIHDISGTSSVYG
jgi:hypothetical protein